MSIFIIIVKEKKYMYIYLCVHIYVYINTIKHIICMNFLYINEKQSNILISF